MIYIFNLIQFGQCKLYRDHGFEYIQDCVSPKDKTTSNGFVLIFTMQVYSCNAQRRSLNKFDFLPIEKVLKTRNTNGL